MPASSNKQVQNGGSGAGSVLVRSSSAATNAATKSDLMYDAYQAWALKTYGDSAKTKTVTKKKYNRIVKILKGEESSSVENSKFRFWVKAKGFRLGPLDLLLEPRSDQEDDEEDTDSMDASHQREQTLYVACSKTGATTSSSPKNVKVEGSLASQETAIYKRVAVVENFYDIIYDVHVEMDGRSGKHAGQKRTYRAVAEMYAFLPREAVTRFLMSCADCQKRMHLQGICHVEDESPEDVDDGDSFAGALDMSKSENKSTIGRLGPYEDSIETVILSAHDGNQGRGLKRKATNHQSSDGHTRPEKALAAINERQQQQQQQQQQQDKFERPKALTSASPHDADEEDDEDEMDTKHGIGAQSSGNGLFDGQGAGSPKDEDEDDEDDDVDMDVSMRGDQNGHHDPERLKAFNMFVRLFVDENLDRMTPISRQPKEKIQAIIDSCARQFPEFGERARKRIRTYLKSCRRTRRHKAAAVAATLSPSATNNASNCNDDSSFTSSTATTPLTPTTASYHMTSAMAEQILATACDNEYQNAKRMRLGLAPVSVNVTILEEPSSDTGHHGDRNHSKSTGSTLSGALSTGSSSGAAVQLLKSRDTQHTSSSSLLAALCQQQKNKLESEATKESVAVNGKSNGNSVAVSSHNGQNGSIMAGFDALQRIEQASGNGSAPSTVSSSINGQQQQQHHTNSSTSGGSPRYSLNPGEMAAVKQLVAGYRESAAFLLRSADELENLLLQQT